MQSTCEPASSAGAPSRLLAVGCHRILSGEDGLSCHELGGCGFALVRPPAGPSRS